MNSRTVCWACAAARKAASVQQRAASEDMLVCRIEPPQHSYNYNTVYTRAHFYLSLRCRVQLIGGRVQLLLRSRPFWRYIDYCTVLPLPCERSTSFILRDILRPMWLGVSLGWVWLNVELLLSINNSACLKLDVNLKMAPLSFGLR